MQSFFIMNRHQEKQRTANKVLPKAGQNGFDWTFGQGSIFVLRLNFCAKNPPAVGNTQTASHNTMTELTPAQIQQYKESFDRMQRYDERLKIAENLNRDKLNKLVTLGMKYSKGIKGFSVFVLTQIAPIISKNQ